MATVTATLSFASAQDVTVSLSFTGTALATQYTTSATSVLVSAGTTTGTITITANDDVLDNLDNSVVLSVASVDWEDGDSLASASTTTVTITDDDPHPAGSITSSVAIMDEQVRGRGGLRLW